MAPFRLPGRARLWVLLGGLAACSPTFRLNRYPTPELLYGAAMREFNAKHWTNAIQAFEKLTLELPARDTLLPRSHYYLAIAHQRQGDRLLAAQSFTRLYESFPDDTLADDALYEAAQSYQRLWRRPELDAQYGQSALLTYQTLLSAYPDTPRRDEAAREMDKLQNWFATKDYLNGMQYFRRKMFDSGIIYFKDVVRLYPNTPRVRDAYLRLAESYKAIRYREDVEETCATLRQRYPGDREVRDVCGTAAATVARDTTVRDTLARDATKRPNP